MIKIGLLGAGRIGQVHARTLMTLPGATTAAVSDYLPEAAEALASKTGAAVMTSDDIIADPQIDAVVIGTPTTTHYDIIHQAAENGKAIFCEKPIDLSVDRIHDCIATVTKAGVPFMTAFNRRFDPNFMKVEAQLRSGAIGDVEMVTIQSRDPSPPPIGYVKTSGGLFRDMMIHDLDMARFLLGEDPIEVFAHASCLVDPEIGEAGDIDTAMVSLRTASGKLCQISNSRRAAYGYDQRIEVHGSGGMLRADNVLTDTVEIATGDGYRKSVTEPFFLERYAAAYTNEMGHFVDCLNAGKPMTPSIEDGLKAQVLADAADESHKTGKPIAL